MINFPDAPAEGQVYSAGTASWLYTGGKWTAAPAAPGKYVVGCFVPGTLTASQALLVHRVSKAVTLPANFAAYAGYASQAGGTAAATASTVITVARALAASPTGFSDVGTIIFAAGGTTPTFATSAGAAVAFAQGDVLRLAAPASADATFAGFSATIVMQEA
jgi:hypothetical protein